jgi:hypothetical protein
MKIDAGPTNLKELFDGDKLVEIPSFQRNYVWKNENVRQLLADAVEAGERGDTHFFGPVVLLKRGQDYEIVDGQQRITTSIITISILRDLLLDKRYFNTDDVAVAAFRDEMKQAWNGFLFKSQMGMVPKFRAGWLIRELVDKAILPDPHQRTVEITKKGAGLSKSEVADTRELRRVYYFVRGHLTLKFEPLSVAQRETLMRAFFKGFSNNFQIHSMVVEDEMDAYQLFESINYLGIKLEPGDLLKSLTLRTIQSNNQGDVSKAIDQWDDFAEKLQGYPISKFLRHYLLTKTKSSVRASMVFPIFKGIILSKPSAAKTTLQELRHAAGLYSFLLGDAPLHYADADKQHYARMTETAQKLHIFSETHRVLLLKILLSDNLTAQMKAKAFRATEYLVFRTVSARDNAQQIEDRYQALGFKLEDVKNNTDLDAWVDDVCSNLLSDDNMKSAPVANSSKNGLQYDPREDLARYALGVISTELSLGWKVDTSLEHLAPQNPKTIANWNTKVGTIDDSYQTVIHWWGNLTLLEQPLNSKVSNREWHIKVDGDASIDPRGLKHSGFELTKRVANRKDWTQAEIEARGVWLLETLLTLRSRAWVDSGVKPSPLPTWW